MSGQTEIWGGFGIQANYSYQDSSTSSVDSSGAELNLPYLSKHTVNVIPYFESGIFQARLSYNYRSSYFRTIGRLNSREMVAPYSQLDFSAGVNLTKEIDQVQHRRLMERVNCLPHERCTLTHLCHNGLALSQAFLSHHSFFGRKCGCNFPGEIDRQQRADEHAVAFLALGRPAVTVGNGRRQLLGVETALGAGRHDDGVLHPLRLHQA